MPWAPVPCPSRGTTTSCSGHGSGGQLTAELIQRLFLPAFGNEVLGGPGRPGRSSASARRNGVKAPRIAFTTDSFVVRPLFFPGGDIGQLAVHGTVNDLAVGGARPLFLSAAFILEEGLPLADLRRIVASMRAACDEAGVALVTGDTKVVDRGKGDQVFITTSGIGLVPEGRSLSIRAARPGDRILRLGHDRRPRHRHHVGARGARVRDGAGERHGPARPTWPGRCSRRARDPLHARPDPRRAVAVR